MTTKDVDNFTVKSLSSPMDGLADQAAYVQGPEAKLFYDIHSLKSLFYSEDWVYISVDLLASEMSSPYPRVMKKSYDQGKLILNPAENHPVQKILENPNEWMDSAGFFYHLAVEYFLMGNAAGWYARSARQLLPLATESIQMQFNDHTGKLDSYLWTPDSVTTSNVARSLARFSAYDVLHVRRPNPSSYHWGLSPFIPGARSVMFNRFSEEYLNKFYSKGAKPQIIVESEAVTREQMDILRTSFEDHYSGRYNERKALVLPKGAKANPVLNRIADQELIDLIRVNRETILNLLRIPKHAVSLQEAGSLGSEEHKMALKYMWSATIKPALKRFSGHFTKFFAAELGPDYCIEFDTTDVEIFHEDLLQKAELAEKMLATRTLNEVRREIWEADPVEGGDTVRGVQSPYDVQPALPIPPTTGGNPEESTEPDPLDANKLLEPEKPKTQKADFQAFYSKNKEAVDSHHKRIDEVLAGNVQGMETWAQEQLLAQAEAAFKALKTSEKASLDKEQFKKNLSSEMAKLYKNYRDGYVQKLSGVQETGYSLQLGMVFDADARAAVEAVRERDESKRVKILEARGLQSFQLVAKTSAKTIMEIVGEGMEAKNTIAEIAKNISAFFSKDAYYRAQRIARTEVLTAVSLGQWAAVKNASDHVPNLKKMWMSAQDSRVRDTHAYLDGAVVGFDEEFENGLKFPREPGGVPSEVIQCRCSLAVVSEKDIDLIQ